MYKYLERKNYKNDKHITQITQIKMKPENTKNES